MCHTQIYPCTLQGVTVQSLPAAPPASPMPGHLDCFAFLLILAECGMADYLQAAWHLGCRMHAFSPVA